VGLALAELRISILTVLTLPRSPEIADFADIPSASCLALPKSVDNGNLGLNEFVIQWMSV
jgi:hypothetical protein